MGGQLSQSYLSNLFFPSLIFRSVYAVLTELPAVFLLYDSSIWSGAFLILIFSVSVWNGGGFYIEVFGRKSVSRFFTSFILLKLVFLFFLGLNESLKPCEKNWRKAQHAQGIRHLNKGSVGGRAKRISPQWVHLQSWSKGTFKV